MKQSRPTSAFITVPATVFLIVAAALLFLRQPIPKGGPLPKQVQPDTLPMLDTLPPAMTWQDSIMQLPDSLNPFTQLVDLKDQTERVLAVKQCGTCHEREYRNWSDGPHAHAYRGMRNLYDQALDSVHGYFPKTYSKWISKNMHVCFQCHATENLYETNFKGIEYETEASAINQTKYPDLMQMGRPRMDPRTFTTGVDCYTCHYNGERIITTEKFKPDPSKEQMPGYCNPLPTPFFSVNTNCVTCHQFAHHTMEANEKKGMTFAETNCLKCHMEYDDEGRATHFMQWRFADHKRHPEPSPKGGLFDALKFTVERGDQAQLVVDWANTISPHGLTECGEVVLDIDVYDQRGRQILDEEIRLNRKSAHDTILREQLLGEEPPGVVGYHFDPSDPPILEIFPLQGKDIRSGHIQLTAIDKGQYWGDDRIGIQVYKKRIAF